MNITLNDIYYRQNENVLEYKDIFLATSIGVVRVYAASLDFVNDDYLQLTQRLNEIDDLREKYGNLNIDEVRKTYDNNIYFLISGKFLLAIEYILNSNFKYSVQEFRIIEDIDGLNKAELEDFNELDIVELPSLPV